MSTKQMINENLSKHIMIAWLAGLFEGEGTFHIQKGKVSKNIGITSTDLDVLEKVKENFGGIILKEQKRNPKWKIAYNWTLRKTEALDLIINIYPYLGERRQKRALEYIQYHEDMKKRQQDRDLEIKEMREKVIKMSSEGISQGKIAKILGYDRTYINKIVNNKI